MTRTKGAKKVRPPVLLTYADVFPDPEPEDLPTSTNNPRYKLLTAAAIRVRDTATGEEKELFGRFNRRLNAGRKKKLNLHLVTVEYAGPEQLRRLVWIVDVMKGPTR